MGKSTGFNEAGAINAGKLTSVWSAYALWKGGFNEAGAINAGKHL